MNPGSLKVALAVIFSLLLGWSNAWASTAMTFTDDSEHGFTGMTIGWEFTLRNDLTVGQLGYYDAHRNGLAVPHQVGIFDVSSRSLIVSGTVSPSDPLDGFFRYTSVTPTRLSRGKKYLVAGFSQDPSGNQGWDSVGIPAANSITMSRQVVFRGWVWGSGQTLAFPSKNTPTKKPWANSDGYMIVANFKTASASQTPPRPPTMSHQDVLSGKSSDRLYQEVQSLYGRYSSTRPGQADCSGLNDVINKLRAYEPSRQRVPQRWAYTVRSTNSPTIGDLARDRQDRIKSGQEHCFNRKAALYNEVQQIYLRASRSCTDAKRAVDRLNGYRNNRQPVPSKHRYTVRYPNKINYPTIGDLAYDRILRIRQSNRGCF